MSARGQQRATSGLVRVLARHRVLVQVASKATVCGEQSVAVLGQALLVDGQYVGDVVLYFCVAAICMATRRQRVPTPSRLASSATFQRRGAPSGLASDRVLCVVVGVPVLTAFLLAFVAYLGYKVYGGLASSGTAAVGGVRGL
eukprot:scaffold2707_cov417-Prasinococcus_capsulatus_cf.AAC.12